MALIVSQIIIAFFLILTIMLQSRGSTAGISFFGQAGGSFRSKKGIEKFLFYLTILLAIAFVSVSLVSLLI